MVNSTLTLSCTFAGITAAVTGKTSDPEQVVKELAAAITTLQRSEAAGRLIYTRQIANRLLPDLADEVNRADAFAARAAEPAPEPAPVVKAAPEDTPTGRLEVWGARRIELE